MITINVPERAQLALDSLNQNKLQCQNPPNDACLYQNSEGFTCVVGAMMTSQARTSLRKSGDNSANIHQLIHDKRVKIEGATEREMLALQRLHDDPPVEDTWFYYEADLKPLGVTKHMGQIEALRVALNTLVARKDD